MIEINQSSIATAVDNMGKIIADNKLHSDYSFDFHPFKAQNTGSVLAAVDGSHHNLRGTNFVFSTLRTGYHLFQNGIKKESVIDPIRVEFIANNDDPKIGYLVKHEEYYQTVTGDLPRGKMDFDKVTERIRTLLEWERVNQLVDRLCQDDIIIFDGSLISGQITTNHEFYNQLVFKAKEKGIALVGLSKDTSLSMDSASVPVVLLESSRKHFPNKNWFVSYKDTFFVKFTKFTNLVFRLDAIIPDHLTMEDIVSRVGAYALDRPTLGYPFPMQKIHDSVRISELEMDYCFEQFKSQCVKSGLSEEMISKMFHIYHDDLDKISFGR